MFKLIIALLLGSVQAKPFSPPPYKNLAVWTRSANSTFTHNDDMVQAIRSNPSSYQLSNDDLKRDQTSTASMARLLRCSDITCLNCDVLFNATFTVSFCIPAARTECIVIEDLDNAKVAYWANDDCNGRMTTYHGCQTTGTMDVAATGTSSIGLQLGC